MKHGEEGDDANYRYLENAKRNSVFLLTLSGMSNIYPTIKIGSRSQKRKEEKETKITERHFFPCPVRLFKLIIKLVDASAAAQTWIMHWQGPSLVGESLLRR